MTRISEISSESIDEISGHDYLRKYAKSLLKNSLFIGTFQEKRFVESLNAYRDVITIVKTEKDFIKNIRNVKKKIDDDLLKKPWVGITEPDTIGAPVGFNLWVELREEVFGKYWFKVKTVEFRQQEIRLKLEIIRPVNGENSPSNNNASSRNKQSLEDFDFRRYLNELRSQVKQNLADFYTTVLTFKNVKQSVIFLSLLVITMVAGLLNIIQYLMEYMLKLIREISGLMKAMTPIIISFINMVGRTIFGLFSMIMVLCKSKPKPQPVYNNYISFDPRDPRVRYNQYFAGQLPYYPTNGGSGPYTVDAAYKTHGYKVQSPIRLKIARNSPDVSKYIEKNSVMRLTTSDIGLSL